MENPLDILERTIYCFTICETRLNKINIAANLSYVLAMSRREVVDYANASATVATELGVTA